jgi:hypothetical protein
MHLVYKALDSRAIPSSLPKELLKPAKSDDFGNGGFVANFPTDIVPVAPVVPPPARPAPPPSGKSAQPRIICVVLIFLFL